MEFKECGYACGVSIVLVWVSMASADDGVKDEIIKTWREREAGAKTVEAEFEESFLLIKPLEASSDSLDPDSDPASTKKEKRNRRVVIKNSKLYHRMSGLIWSPITQSTIFDEMTSTFDGEIAKSLHINAKHQQGYVHSKPHHADRFNLHLLPLLARFRPLADGISSFSPDKWEVVETDVKVGDAHCVMLREGKKADVRYRELWLDAEKKYALVRRRDVFEDRTENEVQIAYQEDDAFGWVPESWEVNRYSNGRLIGHSIATVKRLAINQPVPDVMFNLEFPAGIPVHGALGPKAEEQKPRE